MQKICKHSQTPSGVQKNDNLQLVQASTKTLPGLFLSYIGPRPVKPIVHLNQPCGTILVCNNRVQPPLHTRWI